MPGTHDDDEGTRPPPHPLDRTWIHPSELFAATRSDSIGAGAAPPSPTSRSWRRDALLTVAAGTIGAVAAVAALGIVGAFDREKPRLVAAHLPAGTADAAQVAARVVPGIAAVISTVDGTERRGSGIAVGAHEILTTASVVDGLTNPGTPDSGGIEVSVANGHRHAARVVGRDSVTGLVLLSVPTLRVEPAQLANPNGLRAGDWVAAVGRTATSGPWVTSGVVTATGGWSTDPAGGLHAGMITTSTELADEARGGALVDQHGHVVGILAGADTAPARGTAMPVDMASNVATQLATKGWASHGALGLRAADSRTSGASVTEIAAGSGAAAAGLLVGDRVVAIDAVKTPDSATLVYELRRRAAGQRVRVTVVRGNHTVHMTATLDDAADLAVSTPPPIDQPAAQPLAAVGR
jgi:Trypsin-like serine proteases, typically periplasmic, contain C-terminal PDZ domain